MWLGMLPGLQPEATMHSLLKACMPCVGACLFLQGLFLNHPSPVFDGCFVCYRAGSLSAMEEAMRSMSLHIERQGDKIERKIERQGNDIERQIERQGDKIERQGDKIERQGNDIERLQKGWPHCMLLEAGFVHHKVTLTCVEDVIYQYHYHCLCDRTHVHAPWWQAFFSRRRTSATVCCTVWWFSTLKW